MLEVKKNLLDIHLGRIKLSSSVSLRMPIITPAFHVYSIMYDSERTQHEASSRGIDVRPLDVHKYWDGCSHVIRAFCRPIKIDLPIELIML